MQLSATSVAAPTTPIATRSAASKPGGLGTPEILVLPLSPTSPSQAATKRACFVKGQHGGQAGKAQAEQPSSDRSSVITRGMSHEQPPPHGKWARRSGLLVTPKGQGNLAPSKVQVYKLSFYF